ncbi:hypothetical protein VNI00_003081 [Paramarasmius palmivorus]|uniref:Uncharacterized protein n=1 Tax=Paramarasmius palmivorus TaxID=297713 RepID=A0AAW0DRZ2_9AGAR
MDGNNSLKQVDPQYRAGQTREDDRELPDYIAGLEEDTVDQFKDEVRKGQSTSYVQGEVKPTTQPPGPDLSTSEESPPHLNPAKR